MVSSVLQEGVNRFLRIGDSSRDLAAIEEGSDYVCYVIAPCGSREGGASNSDEGSDRRGMIFLLRQHGPPRTPWSLPRKSGGMFFRGICIIGAEEWELRGSVEC